MSSFFSTPFPNVQQVFFSSVTSSASDSTSFSFLFSFSHNAHSHPSLPSLSLHSTSPPHSSSLLLTPHLYSTLHPCQGWLKRLLRSTPASRFLGAHTTTRPPINCLNKNNLSLQLISDNADEHNFIHRVASARNHLCSCQLNGQSHRRPQV